VDASAVNQNIIVVVGEEASQQRSREAIGQGLRLAELIGHGGETYVDAIVAF
jgi:hypothetical protein